MFWLLVCERTHAPAHWCVVGGVYGVIRHRQGARAHNTSHRRSEKKWPKIFAFTNWRNRLRFGVIEWLARECLLAIVSHFAQSFRIQYLLLRATDAHQFGRDHIVCSMVPLCTWSRSLNTLLPFTYFFSIFAMRWEWKVSPPNSMRRYLSCLSRAWRIWHACFSIKFESILRRRQ